MEGEMDAVSVLFETDASTWTFNASKLAGCDP